MSMKTPRVSEAAVYASNLPGGSIRLDTPAWFNWLEQEATRSFSYPIFDGRCGYIIGFMSVRKEARRRGGQYWSVYRREGGGVRKIYLGRSGNVTAARLEEVATSWLRERAAPEPQGARAADWRQRRMRQQVLAKHLAAQL
jgi:hypothetical protein